jgi:hypothetical protein
MKLSCARLLMAAWLLLAGSQVRALPFDAELGLTADDAGGRSVDAQFSFSPTPRLTISAGGGQTRGSDDTGNPRGTALDAGVSWHGERAGAALSFDRFADDSNYLSQTLGARLWLTAGDFELALLGRRRDMEVELTLALPQRTLRRDQQFAALGAGLQLAFNRGNFSAYLMALGYDYDDDFEQFLALRDSPQLVDRPRIEALVGSFITQAQGAIDRQSGAGIEQTFGRHALALDVSSVRDAIDDSRSTSVALTWRHAYSARFDLSVSGGLVDSDRYGNIGFAGVSAAISN